MDIGGILVITILILYFVAMFWISSYFKKKIKSRLDIVPKNTPGIIWFGKDGPNPNPGFPIFFNRKNFVRDEDGNIGVKENSSASFPWKKL